VRVVIRFPFEVTFPKSRHSDIYQSVAGNHVQVNTLDLFNFRTVCLKAQTLRPASLVVRLGEKILMIRQKANERLTHLRSHISVISLIFTLIFVALLMSLTQPARAGINLKNGNFYITYTDMILGQPELHVARTYNSKANKTLSFGFGWGSDFDTFLTVVGDGTVVLNENGSGARNYYRPPRLDPAEREAIVEEMLIAMEAAGWISSDAQLEETRVELNTDAGERRRLHGKLAAIDLMPDRDLAVGERLTSAQTPNVFLVKEPAGYYRRSLTGYERFDDKGQLVELVSQGENGFKLQRNEHGHLREIIASTGERIEVSTNDTGQITQLVSPTGTATYEYDDRKDLLSATNAVGTTFRYEYDAAHNMRFIRYEDGSYLETRYHEETQFASLQRQPDGRVTRYDYGKNPISEPDIIEHYYTQTRNYENEADEIPFSDRTVAYRVGRDRFGNTYTAGITETTNGTTIDKRYHPCGNPTLIERGNQRTEFDYDDKCRLIFKKSNNEQIRLEYERRHSKISRVETTDLLRDTQSSSDFEYNLRGNLTMAQDSKGRRAELTYDAADQISKMKDQDGQVLNFVYGPLGKPIQIEIEGLGRIDVEYDSNGEIENVASDQGHQMALRVTQAFQGLLSLVKPAGVNFDL
jgi:YD repeat-containing protein